MLADDELEFFGPGVDEAGPVSLHHDVTPVSDSETVRARPDERMLGVTINTKVRFIRHYLSANLGHAT